MTETTDDDKKKTKLWLSVCVTNPAMTKRMGHGAKLTAIDAYSQIERATEVWGPYGETWSLQNLKYEYVKDQTLLKDKIVEQIVELSLDCTFTAPDISFPLSSDIAYRKGGDCKKKLLTDCITKGLSYLGFNADVFRGKFDDQKYVDDLKKEFAKAGDDSANDKDKQQPVQEDDHAKAKAAIAKFSESTKKAFNHLVDKKSWTKFAIRVMVIKEKFDEAGVAMTLENDHGLKVTPNLAGINEKAAEKLDTKISPDAP